MDAWDALGFLSEDESQEEAPTEEPVEKPLDFQALQPHLGKETSVDPRKPEGLERIYNKLKEKLSETSCDEDGAVVKVLEVSEPSNQPTAPPADEMIQMRSRRRALEGSLVDSAYEKSQPQKILDYSTEQSEGDVRLQGLQQGDFCRKCGMKLCRCVDYSDYGRKRLAWPAPGPSKAFKRKGPGA